jgi:hypothetical protein
MTPIANMVVPLVVRRACCGDGDFTGVFLCRGPLVKMGEGLGNHPLANLSATVCGRCVEVSSMGDKERRVLRAGDGGSLAMGVIRGKGYPELNAPPAEDEEVLLPQLELRLPPPVH